MNKKLKKILLIIGLILIIVAVVVVIVLSTSGKREEKVTTNTDVSKKTANSSVLNSGSNTQTVAKSNKEVKPTKEIKADDGIIYTITDEQITPQIIIGDNYFDTTLADIIKNQIYVVTALLGIHILNRNGMEIKSLTLKKEDQNGLK